MNNYKYFWKKLFILVVFQNDVSKFGKEKHEFQKYQSKHWNRQFILRNPLKFLKDILYILFSINQPLFDTVIIHIFISNIVIKSVLFLKFLFCYQMIFWLLLNLNENSFLTFHTSTKYYINFFNSILWWLFINNSY